MQKRTFLQLTVGAALAATLGLGIGAAQAQKPVIIGVVGPKTGPLAGGAAITHFPNFRLWAHEINEAGGLKLKEGRRKVKLIEYDDRTNPGETIKAVQRLATQDKADFIMAPYGTGFNLATAPIFAKHGYPQIAQAAVTDKVDDLTKRFPNLFFFQGTTTQYASTAVNVLKKLMDEGKIGKRVAVVNVGDTFGIELANAARPLFKAAGFEIVYDKSYPLGTQDLAPVIKAAKAAKPDAFVAWSYPPDTFGLAEQAKIENLQVKAYYSAVATAFPGFIGKFGKSAEGILGAGGIKDTPELQAFYKRLKKVTGVDGDYWGNPVYYSMLQVITQAIEGVGSMDRKAIAQYIKDHKFQTLIGEIDVRNQKLNWLWTVGQWQDGVFNGVAGVNVKGGKAVRLKKGW
ncbi:MAG: amino acid ABC transporter substrate-binding protein [Rhodospirillaceae bacterium]|jgi:branched-chain amino acid transport system substrate-binding protein|nr:amino acid ABC transporter substrate-binding protein [Rhodospirillaceae bacterium]MBT3884835.1 amino acid ABC transporter substrate-binding protein [Rhodospirillaceae bacterium]MBT4116819.1 amino acid ABC transporter substrate-binding protein [Rhodospirillaceae bacterium]MBT4673507.1 amino acid ABC transporter substrate-binding protein [Rhodospirillaceae bacterium]MBT4719367.1 amino acid ABC transporter substrate-binding protein [Rhodospirillaceae bacterium]